MLSRDPAMPIYCARFSPDGRRLMTGGLGGMVVEWDGAAGQQLRVILDTQDPDPEPGDSDLQTDDSPLDAGGPDRSDADYSLGAGRGRGVSAGLDRRLHRQPVKCVAYSADGRLFAAGAGTVVVLWREIDSAVFELLDNDGHPVDAVAISPDGRWLAAGSRDPGVDTLRGWQLSDGTARNAIEPFTSHRHVGGVSSLCFSPDSRLLVAGGYKNSGYTGPIIYEVETGEALRGLRYDMTRSLDWSPDGRMIATGDDYGSVRFWDPATGLRLGEANAQSGIILAVRFSPDSRFVATGCSQGGVRVWDTRTLQLVAQHQVEGAALAFHFDGGRRSLVVAAFGRVNRPRLVVIAAEWA
jgi:WD40 repeat protein